MRVNYKLFMVISEWRGTHQVNHGITLRKYPSLDGEQGKLRERERPAERYMASGLASDISY